MRKVINIGLAAFMLLAIGACGGKEKEIKSVKIGEQTWMAENLNDPSKGGKCYEDDLDFCQKYGRLYTWDEAMKACPEGWHLPSKEEWEVLVNFAGSELVAGNKLKAKNGWNWNEQNKISGNGTDEYGFSALPGGNGNSEGNFDSFGNVGESGSWWSSYKDERNNDLAYKRYMDNGTWNVGWNNHYKTHFLSVRCIKEAK